MQDSSNGIGVLMSIKYFDVLSDLNNFQNKTQDQITENFKYTNEVKKSLEVRNDVIWVDGNDIDADHSIPK